MKQVSRARLFSATAMTLAGALLTVGGTITPAAAATTVELRVPVTVPAGVTASNMDEYSSMPALYQWTTVGGQEHLVDVWAYGTYDPATSTFVYEDVPAADNYILFMNGGDYIAEEFWDGASTVATATRFSTKNSGATKTLSTWTLDPAKFGTVTVPVTFPSTVTVDSTVPDHNTVSLERYSLVYGDDDYTVEGWYPEFVTPTFNPATSTFTFSQVKLSSKLIAYVEGRYIKPTYVGGTTAESATQLSHSTAGGTTSFAPTTLTAANLYTVEIPLAFPSYMTDAEIQASAPEILTLYPTGGDYSLGSFDLARKMWTTKYVQENNDIAFYSYFGGDFLASGYNVGASSYSDNKTYNVTGATKTIRLPKWTVPTWDDAYPEWPVLNATKPSISGAAVIGKTLTANQGLWADSEGYDLDSYSVKYQWKANGTTITGATGKTLKIPASLQGKTITVTVRAFAMGNASASSTSNATAKVLTAAQAAAKISLVKAPGISGSARVGAKLTAVPGKWDKSGLTVKYQWFVKGKAVKGATKSTFSVPASAVGKPITLKETVSKPGLTTVSATASATKKVTKSTAKVKGKLAKSSIKKNKSTTITVTVKAPGIAKPTGTVTVRVGSKSVKAKLKTSHKGKIKVTLKGKKLKSGKKQKVTVSFKPSGATAKAVNKSKTTKVAKTLTVAK